MKIENINSHAKNDEQQKPNLTNSYSSTKQLINKEATISENRPVITKKLTIDRNNFKNGKADQQVQSNQEQEISESNDQRVYTDEERIKLANLANLMLGRPQIEITEIFQKENQGNVARKLSAIKEEGIFHYHGKYCIYDAKSLFLFHHKSKFRNVIVWFAEWKWFDYFIILIIAMNSVFLPFYDYTDRDNDSKKNQIIQLSGTIFSVIFTVEAAIKIISMGFIFHRCAYLRDGWNWIDFFVVLLGIAEMIPKIPTANFKALRTMRVLRPLKTINAIPSMRRLLSSLFGSLPKLGNAIIFLFFIFILFDILGVQQFSGAFYQRCRLTPEPLPGMDHWPIDYSINRLCSIDGNGMFQCPEGTYCGSPDQYGLSLKSENLTSQDLIFYGFVTFDNIAVGMLTIFQAITLEGWTQLMYNMMDANMTWMAILYFCLLVILGAFFLLQVILAIIMDAFDEVDKKQIEEKIKKETDIRKAVMQQRQREEYLNNKRLGAETKIISQILPIEFKDDEGQKCNEGNDEQWQNNSERPMIDFASNTQNLDFLNADDVYSPAQKSFKSQKDDTFSRSNSECKLISTGLQIINLEKIKQSEVAEEFEESQKIKSQRSQIQQNPDSKQTNQIKRMPEGSNLSSFQKYIADIPLMAQKYKFVKFFFIIAIHPLFGFVITLLIISNVIILAMDRFPEVPSQVNVLEVLNDSFSWCFFAEMVIKLIGLGPKIYVKDKFNIFDCIVVVVSIIENVINWAGVEGGTKGAISAFRGVRLLRVFKLARSWTSFRELLSKIMTTLKDISNFSVLLFIFMFVYTLLGMEMYAYNVSFDLQNNPITLNTNDLDLSYEGVDFIFPRTNFNDFLQGFTTIFIILIGDGWNNIMYDHMRTVGSTTSIPFFVSWYIVGNLVLLNLFLAILLKNFEEPHADFAQEEVKESKVTKIKSLLSEKLKSLVKLKENSQLSQQDLKESQSTKFKQWFFSISNNKNNLFSKQNLNASHGSDHSKAVSIEVSEMIEKDSCAQIDEDNKSQSDAERNSNGLHLNIKDMTYFINDSNQATAKAYAGDEKATSAYNTVFERESEQAPIRLMPSINAERVDTVDDNQETKDYKYGAESQKKIIRNKELTLNIQRQESSRVKKSSTLTPRQVETLNVQNDKFNMTGFNNFKSNNKNEQLSQGNSARSHDSQSEKYGTNRARKSIAEIRQRELNVEPDAVIKKIALNGRSLYCFSQTNKIRLWASYVVGYKYFDTFILIMILFSTIMLTLDNPLDNPVGQKVWIMNNIDIGVTIIFTLECVLKILVSGLIINGKKSYLRNTWNIMDFSIVIFAILTLTFQDINLKFIKSLRMLRVLRPLRMISRNPALKIAVQSLINAVPGIVNVLIISFLFLILFGILGTNFYKGRFYYCEMSSVPSIYMIKLVNTKWDCLNSGGEWLNRDYNFDNIFNSIITLFNMISTEGWTNVMFYGVDAVGYEINPIENHSQGNVFFFIFFMIVGHLFILNLFVGVVINTFNNEKEKLGKFHLLTPSQQEWVQVQLMCYKTKPDVLFVTTGNKVRDAFRRIEENVWFDRFIFLCIITNTIALALKWYDQQELVPPILEKINYFFVSVFAVEAIIKLISMGSTYFKQGWNVFDFIIVLGTFFGIIMGKVTNLSVGPQTTVIRSFRIGRIFRLIKKYKELRKIFNTFIIAIPPLANVGGLLLLFLYLYSILGVFMFAGVKLQDNLTVHANFQTFGTAFLTLVRMSTGEAWNDIMYDCAREASIIFSCTSNQSYSDRQKNGIQGCGNKGAAYIYFISFTLMVTFIFLNLFIAIILEGFSSTSNAEDIRIQEDTITKFRQIWKKYDEKGEGYICVYDFEDLILDLIEEEFKQKKELISKKDMFDDDGNLLEGKHIMFDLHLNKILVLKQKCRYGITDKIKSEQGMTFTIERRIKKGMKAFIANLRLPTYKSISFYNFYDILDALAKQIFVNDFKARKVLATEQDDQNPEQNKFLSMVQKEVLEEAKIIDFDQVIDKLYIKGASENIEKYLLMQCMRKKQGKKVATKVDRFLNCNVIDSAFVVHGQVIREYCIKWLERKRQRLEAEQVLVSQTLEEYKDQENLELPRKEQFRTIQEEDNEGQSASQVIENKLEEEYQLSESRVLEEAEQILNQSPQQLDENVFDVSSKSNISPINNNFLQTKSQGFQFAESLNFTKKVVEEEENGHFISITKQKQINAKMIVPIESVEKQHAPTLKQQYIPQNEGLASITKFGKLSKIIGSALNAKILEASRPFTPARILTPALFSNEFKRHVLHGIEEEKDQRFGEMQTATNKESSHMYRNDFSPIVSSFDYSPQNSIYDSKTNFVKQTNSSFDLESEFVLDGDRKNNFVLKGSSTRVPGVLDMPIDLPSPIQSRAVDKRSYIVFNNNALKMQTALTSVGQSLNSNIVEISKEVQSITNQPNEQQQPITKNSPNLIQQLNKKVMKSQVQKSQKYKK